MSLTDKDFLLVDHGSIAIITPQSTIAKTWVESFISDDAQWFGNGFVVEHRYVDDIVDRLLELDMSIEPIATTATLH